MKKPLAPREKLVLALGVLLVVALPLAVDIGCAGPFRTPKSLLAAVLWAALAWLFLARPSFDAWCWPAAAVVGAGLVASLLVAPRGVLQLPPVILASLGFFALRQLPPQGKTLLAKAVVWGGVGQALLALAFYDPASRPASWALLEQGEGRYLFLGTMGNPADVAVYLVLPTLLAASFALAGKRRLLWAAAALLQASVIVATQTLSALAALGVGLVLLVGKRLPADKRLPAAAGLALALLLVVFAVPPLRQRLAVAWQEASRYGFAWVASARGAAWLAAWRMFLAKPLLGFGLGQFEAHSFSFLPQEVLAERGKVLGLETGFGEAHNELLQFLAETGLLGLLALTAALVFAWRRAPQAAPLLPAAPLLAAAAVLASLQFPLHLAATAAQWLAVAALLLPPLPLGKPRSWACAAGPLLLAAASVLAWGQWRAWRAVQAAEVLVTGLRAQGAGEAKKVVAAQAYQGLEAKLALLAWDYRARTVAGNLAREAGAFQEAVDHFRAAVALAERPETRFNLGVTLLSLGQEQEGLQHLVRAVELNPAVLRVVEEPLLAAKLHAALVQRGYFARFPWAEPWLSLKRAP
jgi:O-antigen ligase